MTNGFQNFNIGKLHAGIVAWEKDITEAAKDAVIETVEEAAGDMVGVIYASATPTGERRQADGNGVSGRVETGDMVGDVKRDFDESDTGIEGSWGWTEEFEKYYSFQEDGTRFIEGMDALGSSFVRAEDALKGRLARITKAGS